MRKPLAGRVALVLRPEGGTDRLGALLRRAGARVLAAPAIRVRPPRDLRALDRAVRSLSRFDGAVFASARAAEAFLGRARRLLGRRPPRPRLLWAVGPATARALARLGWRGARVSPVHEGAALARAIRPAKGLRILLPRARGGRPELAAGLRAAGARVRAVEAYRTEDAPGARAAIRRALERDPWVFFTSGSTAASFARAAPGRRVRALSIGPSTSAALRGLGIEPAAEARPHTSEGLAAAARRLAADPPRARLRQTLVRALRAGGEVLRARIGRVRVRYKGRANPVTEADHASEGRVLGLILARFPDHDFLTEERAPRRSGSDYCWVIDPLDGTTNYAHRFPVCCVSIGLLRRGRPLLGGVYDPFRDEIFLAEEGRGATLNGRRIRVSEAAKVEDSLLLTGFAYDRAERADYYLGFYGAFLKRCHDVRRSGSAALDLAWTAAGRADGYWEFNLSPWDVAAGMLLVREAGGKVTDMSGRPWDDPATFGRQTLASNGRLHGAMLRVIRPRLR